VFVGGVLQHVRSRCPCSGVWADVMKANVTGYRHVVQHLGLQLVVSLSIGGVRIAGVRTCSEVRALTRVQLKMTHHLKCDYPLTREYCYTKFCIIMLIIVQYSAKKCTLNVGQVLHPDKLIIG